MKYTIDEAESWVFGQERVLREFKEYQQEQIIQLLTDISEEYDITIKLDTHNIIRDKDGNIIREGEIYDAMWLLINHNDANYDTLKFQTIKNREQ